MARRRLFGGRRYGWLRQLAYLFLAVAIILFLLTFLGIAGLSLAVLQPFIIVFLILFVIALIASLII